jgi:hypothetical protein
VGKNVAEFSRISKEDALPDPEPDTMEDRPAPPKDSREEKQQEEPDGISKDRMDES